MREIANVAFCNSHLGWCFVQQIDRFLDTMSLFY
jgi:hypothetical protein